jgi:hypothetical protein
MVVYQSFHTSGLKVEVPSPPLLDSNPLDKADENLFEKEAEICVGDPISHVAIDYESDLIDQSCDEMRTFSVFKSLI